MTNKKTITIVLFDWEWGSSEDGCNYSYFRYDNEPLHLHNSCGVLCDSYDNFENIYKKVVENAIPFFDKLLGKDSYEFNLEIGQVEDGGWYYEHVDEPFTFTILLMKSKIDIINKQEIIEEINEYLEADEEEEEENESASIIKVIDGNIYQMYYSNTGVPEMKDFLGIDSGRRYSVSAVHLGKIAKQGILEEIKEKFNLKDSDIEIIENEGMLLKIKCNKLEVK